MRNLFFYFCLLITFSSLAEEVVLKTKTGNLKGTIDIPKAGDKHPIVLIIAGSGPTDRDGNNPQMTNNSLKLLSNALVENGFATLRFDKRGIAASESTLSEKEIRFDNFIQDVVDWSLLIKKDSRFSNVIGMGHSQGSLVGMIAANSRGAFDGFVSLCGPAEPVQTVLISQLSKQVSGAPLEIVKEKIDSLANGYEIKEIPEGLGSLFRPSVQPFLISWMKYNPQTEIKKTNIPTLIIGGTTDLQVPAAEAKTLASINERSKLNIIKNMNHVLKFTKETDLAKQMTIYKEPSSPLHPKLIKPILSFLEQFETNN